MTLQPQGWRQIIIAQSRNDVCPVRVEARRQRIDDVQHTDPQAIRQGGILADVITRKTLARRH